MPPKSILVVDDSPTAVNLIKLYLVNLGYEVAGTADTADQALQLLGQHVPDLVLMDINLGEGMNGIEAADIIMNQYGIPVIYVTSYSDDQTLDSAKRSMPFGFINKPFRDNDLRVNIEIALARSTKERGPGGYISGGHVVQDDNPDLEHSVLSEALDHLVSGVVMLNENLQVFYTNKSANKILSGNSPLRLKDRQLICISSVTRRDIQAYIKEKTSMVFTLNHNSEPLHLLLFPLNAQLSNNINNSTGSILFLFNTVHDSERIEEVVRTMYKLSPTEAKIAARLVFNPYLADISTSLGITYNTARTHLKRIYQKTDTNKLPSLIQKIVTGPAGLLIHSTD